MDKDLMLKVYSEAINDYHYRYNFIAYTSYVALFVAGAVSTLVFNINIENIGFKPLYFYSIFFGLTLMLCFAYCYLTQREDDARINAREIAGTIEDILGVPNELKLINKKKENRRKIVSLLPKLFSLFFFIYWSLLLLLVISKYIGIQVVIK